MSESRQKPVKIVEGIKDVTINNETSSVIFAPVRTPKSEDLTIDLVPVDAVRKLEEYRADETKWDNILSIFVGAIIGLIVNWATTEPIVISRISVILLITLIVFVLVIWYATRDYKKRSEKAREEMLKYTRSPSSPSLSSDKNRN